MAIDIGEETGAAAWASYLINDDATGLDDREIALCDAWQARIAPAYVVGVAEDDDGESIEPYFSWSYGFHTGDDCAGGNLLDYVTHTREESAS